MSDTVQVRASLHSTHYSLRNGHQYVAEHDVIQAPIEDVAELVFLGCTVPGTDADPLPAPAEPARAAPIPDPPPDPDQVTLVPFLEQDDERGPTDGMADRTGDSEAPG